MPRRLCTPLTQHWLELISLRMIAGLSACHMYITCTTSTVLLACPDQYGSILQEREVKGLSCILDHSNLGCIMVKLNLLPALLRIDAHSEHHPSFVRYALGSMNNTVGSPSPRLRHT